jgi:predicted RNA-binding protein with RPS1 domain
MCHVSEIADHYVKDINRHYKTGDKVRARVVKVTIRSWKMYP